MGHVIQQFAERFGKNGTEPGQCCVQFLRGNAGNHVARLRGEQERQRFAEGEL